MSKLVIYGPGRVGTTLAIVLERAGHKVLFACAKSPDSPSSRRFKQLTGRPVYTVEHVAHQLTEAEVVILTVPDKAVSLTAQTLADAQSLHPGQIVVHTAGALPSSSLSALRPSGVSLGSVHPLQTFADPKLTAPRIRGTAFSLEGDSDAVATVGQLVRDIGGTPLVIDHDARPRYHAAAVLASNAIVALAAVASELTGLPNGLQALLPLLRGTLDNLETLGIPAALTGPVERGDLTTVGTHLQALQNNPTALHVYCALGEATVAVARQKGSLSNVEQSTLMEMFQRANFTANQGGMLS